MEVKKHAFVGTEEEEDPQAHLIFFHTLCGTFKLKDMSREFILLRCWGILATDARGWLIMDGAKRMSSGPGSGSEQELDRT